MAHRDDRARELLQRERTGVGRWIRTSLLEAMIALMDFQAARYLVEALSVPPCDEAARDADVVILSLGENKDMTGEAHSRGRIGLPGRDRKSTRLNSSHRT